MSASLIGLRAITMFVEDPQRSKAFYQTIFGLDLLNDDANAVTFDFGNTVLNLLKVSEAPDLIGPAVVADPASGSRVQLTIRVDDADAVCADLNRLGVTLVNGPMDRIWGVRTACFADPDGHLWEIAQPLPDGSA